ncbi:hypothetical protein [Helicobacter bizzozeronii]|uniref:hypothetical protein n=1 Tax=Helicobacter bizzozeronii TaxID=56877 RepID=UPI000CEF2550|nr:hypothetical protein [Helicobacter bizzozeronii]
MMQVLDKIQLQPEFNAFMREMCSASELQELLGLTPHQFRILEKKGVFEASKCVVFYNDEHNKPVVCASLKYNTRLNILAYTRHLQPQLEGLKKQGKIIEELKRTLKTLQRQDKRVGLQKERIADLSSTKATYDKENKELKGQISALLEQNKALETRTSDQLAAIFNTDREGIFNLTAKGICIKTDRRYWDFEGSVRNYIKVLQEQKQPDPNKINIATLCEILGLTKQRIYQLEGAGVLAKSEHDSWDLTQTLNQFITYKLQNEESELGVARARKELADAKLKELSYKEKVGELLTFDTIAKALQDIAITISNKLYSLPHLLKRKHRLEAPLIKDMNAEIEGILAELQDPQAYELASQQAQAIAQEEQKLEKLNASMRESPIGGSDDKD